MEEENSTTAATTTTSTDSTTTSNHLQVPSPITPLATAPNSRFPSDETSSIYDFGVHSDADDDADVVESPKEPQTPPPFGAAEGGVGGAGGAFAPDEKFDVYDIELVLLPHKKAEINVRDRRVSSGRPTYKAEKTTHSHLFGKKNMDVVIKRNRCWDANKSEAIPLSKVVAASSSTSSRDRDVSGGGGGGGDPYSNIFYAQDQNTRHLNITSTPQTGISNTSSGGGFTLTPFCGGFDPQRQSPRNGAGGVRESTAHHFFSLPIAWPVAQQAGPKRQAIHPPPSGTPYTGGGFFVFDCHSQGCEDLVTTLWCTRNENRANVKRTLNSETADKEKGDIPIAELRLNTPILDPSKAWGVPAWRRLFRDRHANLYISRSGLDSVFSGGNVNLVLPSSQPGKRYFLAPGQASEVVIAAFMCVVLGIEHDGGLESKKWGWLSARELIEREGMVSSQNHLQHLQQQHHQQQNGNHQLSVPFPESPGSEEQSVIDHDFGYTNGNGHPHAQSHSKTLPLHPPNKPTHQPSHHSLNQRPHQTQIRPELPRAHQSYTGLSSSAGGGMLPFVDRTLHNHRPPTSDGVISMSRQRSLDHPSGGASTRGGTLSSKPSFHISVSAASDVGHGHGVFRRERHDSLLTKPIPPAPTQQQEASQATDGVAPPPQAPHAPPLAMPTTVSEMGVDVFRSSPLDELKQFHAPPVTAQVS